MRTAKLNPSQDKPRPQGVRERNRLRTHDDIYQAAMALFLERDYQEVTVEDVCEAAGISKATFFRYYGNKFGLVDEFNQRIAAKIAAAVDLDKMTAAQALLAATDTLYAEWLNSASQMRNLAEEFLRSGVRRTPEHMTDPMARNMLAPLIEALRAGQERGELIRAFDPRLVAPMIVQAWTLATVRWFAHRDRNEFRRSVRGLVGIIVRGLSAEA